ncbi:MAG: PHP domain-containing protein [Clostridia bacterium]|nr:PHP domain-containing protein [Clostridia bacterium]
MRYIFDHDLHIHSHISLCSNDPAQTNEAILQYAVDNKLNTICLTDHYWDETVPGGFTDFYKQQDTAHIRQALPLPQAEGVRFLFGCETDLDKNCTLGISPEAMKDMAFIIIPTTHLHMNGFTCRGDEGIDERRALWSSRFDAVLDMKLPFEKVGIAHLTCELHCRGHMPELLAGIPDEEYSRLFRKAADRGIGVELNFNSLALTDETKDAILNPYRIAKAEGCKFYFGSDAHHPAGLAREKANAENIIDLLELTEADKWVLA